MMLYLTGAQQSVVDSNWQSPQTEVSKSLGGYVSSTQVPNNALNSLFDLLSMQTLRQRTSETLGFALVNKFSVPVKNVTVKIVQEEDALAKFRIAVVPLSDKFYMEHINNRYSEPMQADWYDAAEELTIVEELAAGSGLGIWLQRYIPEKLNEKTDAELVENFLAEENNVNAQTVTAGKLKTVENVQIVFNYEESEGNRNYSQDYNSEYN